MPKSGMFHLAVRFMVTRQKDLPSCIQPKIIRKVNNMFKILIAKFVAKYGLVPLLLKVGNLAVKATKTKKDDKVWAKVKKLLEDA